MKFHGRSIVADILSTAAMLLFLAALGGCASRTAPQVGAVSPRHASGAAASAFVVTSAVKRSPAYRQAVVAFSGKDYRGALSQIDSLQKTPHLSPIAQAFLLHQRVLCQDAISGRRALTAAAMRSPVTSAPIRHARTPSDADCGPRALMLVCQDLKVPANLPALRAAAGTTANGTTMAGLAKAAKSVHLGADGVQMDRAALSNLSQPAVAWADGNHYIAVLSIHHSLMDPSVNGDTATVHDPNNQREEEMPLDGPTGLLARSGGMLLLLSQYRSN